MFKTIKSVLAPILSLAILVMGNALFVTYTSLRLKLDGINTETIGYIISLYFVGMMLGSYFSHKIIEKLGHIKTYAFFTSIFCVISMLQALLLNVWMWGITRFLCGILIGSLFITIESWLLAKSTPQTKGKILSIYMITFYAAQGSGQFLLNIADPLSMTPFAIIVILSAISIIPISVTKTPPPALEEKSTLNFIKLFKICPLGIITSVFSGTILGAIYGLLPIYAKDIGLSTHQLTFAVSITILGGFILQWPIGHLSDKGDRRKIIMLVGFASAITTIVITFINGFSPLFLYIFLAIFGGFSFTIYPLSISYTSDKVESKDLIAATSGAGFSYGIGSIIGPILASYSMYFLEAKGLFVYLTVFGLFLGIISYIKIKQTPHLRIKEKAKYTNIPSTTPLAIQLDLEKKKKNNFFTS